MKKVLFLFLLGCSIQGMAQIAIGKSTVTNSSCLLEFGPEVRGIRMPLVSNATAITTSQGSMVFDTTTGSFRYFNGTSWSTATAGGTTGGSPTGADSGNGVIIGANTTTATGGALIMEATNKALVLPQGNNVEYRILTPARGLMLWDTAKKAVAVYDGTKWTYF